MVVTCTAGGMSVLETYGILSMLYFKASQSHSVQSVLQVDGINGLFYNVCVLMIMILLYAWCV